MAGSEILTARSLAVALSVILLGILVRFAQALHRRRSFCKNLPGPPYSYLWGHLPILMHMFTTTPKRAAAQTFATVLKELYPDLPDVFYVDLWPLMPSFMFILDTDVMAQVAVKHSFPKAKELTDFMSYVGGPQNLVSSEGAEWKRWRSVFNPGFSVAHLMSLVPVIVDECEVFCEILTKRAKNNELFRMERDATRLTIDIIGRVAIDTRLDSQKGPNELVEALVSQIRLTPVSVFLHPIELIDMPIRQTRAAYNTWFMNRFLGNKLEERFATRHTRAGKSKAVIDLALEAFLKEVKGTTDDDASTAKLDPEFKRAAINNLKTFIFAGHDTTSATICYAFHFLSKNPDCLAKIRQEHDEVFGPDPDAVADQLRNDSRLLNRLPYTLAVTREVLRLAPPASTLRKTAPGIPIIDPVTGNELPSDGFIIYPVDVGVMRNPKYWPDPHTFKPERFLSTSTTKDGSAADSSANFTSNPAWIAFSKGPRNCIGQELAIIETKAILAMTLRKFDFKAAFDELLKLRGDGSGYPNDVSGIQTQFGEEAYQIQLGAAKPREGMPCRIKLRTP